MPWCRLLTGTLALAALLLAGFDGCGAPEGGDSGAGEVSAIPLAAEASIANEMDGELRLHAPATCGDPFLEFDTTSFGGFHVDPGGGGPGTVSFSIGGDSLTATEIRSNEARRVDPSSGRPIEGGAPPGASCTTWSEPDCWTRGEPTAINVDAFDALCALTKGFSTLDLEACELTIWNSQAQTGPGAFEPLVMIALTNLLSGQNSSLIGGASAAEGLGGFTPTTISALNDLAARESTAVLRFYSATYGGDTPTVLVPLSADPNDGLPLLPSDLIVYDLNIPQVSAWTYTGLQRYLTDEQEALFACGPFYGALCDLHGPSRLSGRGLMRTEASALLQSFPRLAGACGSGGWDTTDPNLPQPGTVGFAGEPVCTRYVGGERHILPGCRGPDDPGYDPDVDGTLTGPNSINELFPDERRHPFTDQLWSSEMAVFSWNHLAGLVVLSEVGGPSGVQVTEFDPDDPFRLDGCSFANPLDCSAVASMLSMTTLAPAEDPSQPPLRRWIWEAGAEYLVTEATGDLADFLGWKLFAFGPEQSRVSGAEMGLLFFLSPPDPLPPIPDSPMIVRHAGPDGILDTEDDNFAGIAYGLVPDRDRDGVLDDGDGSGVVGDDYCTGGETLDCDDNCSVVSNADQADADGDGIGTACECGDASGDGVVNTIDARLIQRCAVGELPCADLCDVTGEGDCNTIDARLVQRLAVGDLTKDDLSCAARP